MFNRRHMQGSFDIKTMKRLLICHCHRYLRRATCNTLYCREQQRSVRIHCDKQRDWDIDCAICFLCQRGTDPSQRIRFPTLHNEMLRCTGSALQWVVQVTEQICPLPSTGQCWAAEWHLSGLCGEQRAHTETFSASVCLRDFPGWRSSDLIPSFKGGLPYQWGQGQVSTLLPHPEHSQSNSASSVQSPAFECSHPFTAGTAPGTAWAHASQFFSRQSLGQTQARGHFH